MGNEIVTNLDYQGPITGSQKTISKVTSLNASFNGVSGLQEVSLITTGNNATGGITFTTDTNGFAYLKPVSLGVAALYGVTSTAQTFGQTVKTTNTYQPPYVDSKANLQVGETGSYTQLGNVVTTGAGSGPLNVVTTVTFVGKETVTVPAGTFSACRYDSTTGGSTIKGSSWIYRSVVVKSSSPDANGTQLILLKSATVNGAAL